MSSKENLPSGRQPNIVLIMTDQQRVDTIRQWGYSYMHTPAMDRIARNGVSFTQAFAPAATCVASRAALFTGMYPHNTGAYAFYPWGHQRNWVQDLAEGGYRCANIGKMHFIPEFEFTGFQERIIVENPTSPPSYLKGGPEDAWGNYLRIHGVERPIDRHRKDPDWYSKFQGVPWEMEEHLHSDVFIGNNAVAWLDTYNRSEPFFLQVGFTGPHEPYDPLPRHLELYQDLQALPQAHFVENELQSKPPQQKAYQELFSDASGEASIRPQNASVEDIQRMRQHYYAKISTVDEQIGRLLDKLESRGFLENSIILFCSDHGDMLGDHQLAYKWLMYDSIVNVPFMIWDARPSPQKISRTESELVSLMNLGPTILDYAGISAPRYLEGYSLRPCVESEKSPCDSFIFAEDNYLHMIRDREWKLVYYAGQSYGELYHLAVDPHELNNLWDSKEYQAQRTRLKEALLDWISTSCYHNGGYKHSRDSTFEMRFPPQRIHLYD